jgi:hypothetical protein
MSGEILHAMFRPLRSPLLEIPCVLMCFDHVASVIVNANHGIVTEKRFVVRGDEIRTAFVELERAIHEFAVSLMV